VRILLADDAALLREALHALLGRLGHHVVATAVDATDLVSTYESLPTAPDLVSPTSGCHPPAPTTASGQHL